MRLKLKVERVAPPQCQVAHGSYLVTSDCVSCPGVGMFENSARMRAGLRPSPTADSREATPVLMSLDCTVLAQCGTRLGHLTNEWSPLFLLSKGNKPPRSRRGPSLEALFCKIPQAQRPKREAYNSSINCIKFIKRIYIGGRSSAARCQQYPPHILEGAKGLCKMNWAPGRDLAPDKV